MPRLIVLMLIAGFLSGCAIRLSSISSSYTRNPIVTYKIAGPGVDQSWTRLVKLIADSNLPITILDKESGFMQTDILSFVNAYEMDSEKVTMSKPAYVLVQNETSDDKRIEPSYITGNLKVIMLPDNDSLRIQVSIENLKSFHWVSGKEKGQSGYRPLYREVVSTKKLETSVADYLSGHSDSLALYFDKGVIINPRDNYEAYLRRNRNIFIGCYVGTVGAVCVITGIITISSIK